MTRCDWCARRIWPWQRRKRMRNGTLHIRCYYVSGSAEAERAIEHTKRIVAEGFWEKKP